MATKTLNTKVEADSKALAAKVLLKYLVGWRCQLEFERQDEAFSGVLQPSDGDAWQCDAIFEAHWLTAVEPNDDGSYTICVRIPDNEYAEMVAEFEEEQGDE